MDPLKVGLFLFLVQIFNICSGSEDSNNKNLAPDEIQTTVSYEMDEEYDENEEIRSTCIDGDSSCLDTLNQEGYPNNGEHNSSSATLADGNHDSESSFGLRGGPDADFDSYFSRNRYNPARAPFNPLNSRVTPGSNTLQKGPRYMNTNLSSIARKLLPSRCGLTGTSLHVFGGKRAREGQYPWMVALVYKTPFDLESNCGGSIIHKRYVLTAAHCVESHKIKPNWELVSVRIGTTRLRSDPKCFIQPSYPGNLDPDCVTVPKFDDIPIERMVIHSLYDWTFTRVVYNDIALLKLKKDVEFSKTVQPICLPSSPQINAKLKATGWGLREDGTDSPTLLEVDLPLVDCRSVRREEYSSLKSTQICAGGESAKDTCRGDSGGPLMDTHETEILAKRIVGVVSGGQWPCGPPGLPAVYTKVFSFVPWILNNMQLTLNLKPSDTIPDTSDDPKYYSRHLKPRARI
ncbi:hypothetical protein QAD02_005480 [Eretmocerus hayati]|uniref:Uncharacterized protein n=1 Tax=Eretmocerus hayati TaxID=131215 RepID=A0ACC2NTL5_9HYME|nr:hypothetical protein QAD02_005480 [Eretmocerus hayati]